MKEIKKVEAYSFDDKLYADEHGAVCAAISGVATMIVDTGGGTANLGRNLMQHADFLAPLLTRLLELEKPTAAPAKVDPSTAENHAPGCGLYVNNDCTCNL